MNEGWPGPLGFVFVRKGSSLFYHVACALALGVHSWKRLLRSLDSAPAFYSPVDDWPRSAVIWTGFKSWSHHYEVAWPWAHHLTLSSYSNRSCFIGGYLYIKKILHIKCLEYRLAYTYYFIVIAVNEEPKTQTYAADLLETGYWELLCNMSCSVSGS